METFGNIDDRIKKLEVEIEVIDDAMERDMIDDVAELDEIDEVLSARRLALTSLV